MLGKWFPGGTELSEGQWYRIALARALYSNADLILLDEPTNSMDPWTEERLMKKFHELVDGRTVILITHRVATAIHSDYIYVMDDGKIVESGTHSEMINSDSVYYKSLFIQNEN